MAIYDHNGTSETQIGKVYDHNGTSETQIGKVYDHNGTSETLIYTAEDVLYTAGDASGWTATTSAASISYGTAYMTITTSANSSGTNYGMVRSIAVDLTGYDTVKITRKSGNNAVNFIETFGVATGAAVTDPASLTATKTFTPSSSTQNVQSTITLDVSDIDGTYYVYCCKNVAQSTYTGDLKIYSVVVS